jgi:hypothetical protein
VTQAVDKPIMIGEFSFVRSGRFVEADAGMRQVFDPDYQGRAYACYFKGALETPSVVGAHIFRRREHVIGRADTPPWGVVRSMRNLAEHMYDIRYRGGSDFEY